MMATAAIFDGPGKPLRLEEVPLPDDLQPGETLVKISLSTICGSDLHTLQGRRESPTPGILGHEGVGTVIAAGAGRESWLGKRVTWTSADSCGKCAPCTDYELPQKCEHVFKYGHSAFSGRHALSGTYASHILLRPGTHLVAVPESLDDAEIAPANCALATMVAITEHLPKRRRIAVIQGAGLLGLYGCALLRARGVERVVVVDTQESRLAEAEKFGVEAALGSALPKLGTGKADVVIEVTGIASVVQEGMKLLRPGGHYLLAGMVHPESALNLTGEAIIRGCVTMRGVHNYAPRHLEESISFLAQHRDLPLGGLVSPPIPLSQINEALCEAAERRWPRVSLAPG